VRMHAPEKIVRQLFRRRLLEAHCDATCWIHPGQNVADHAVFARGVEPLEYDEKRMLPFGIHEILQLRHFLDVLLNLGQSVLVGFMFSVVIGIEMFEPNLAFWFYDEFF